MSLYEHVHLPRLHGHPHKTEHSATSLGDRIGLAITTRVGTMWCAAVFAMLTLVSLPAAIASGDKIIIVAWIAQTFLQLVLLPVIIVGQNVQAKAADARSQQTYDDAEAVLHEARQIQEHLEAQDAILERLFKEATLLRLTEK